MSEEFVFLQSSMSMKTLFLAAWLKVTSALTAGYPATIITLPFMLPNN